MLRFIEPEKRIPMMETAPGCALADSPDDPDAAEPRSRAKDMDRSMPGSVDIACGGRARATGLPVQGAATSRRCDFREDPRYPRGALVRIGMLPEIGKIVCFPGRKLLQAGSVSKILHEPAAPCIPAPFPCVDRLYPGLNPHLPRTR